MQTTDQPQHQEDNEHGAEHPTQARAAIASMSVVATSATKQEQEYYDQQNETHVLKLRFAMTLIKRSH
jgi:hypothetical protein